MSTILHVIAIPCPAQGHVIPMMKLMQKFAEHGFRITFLNTDFNHLRVLKAMFNEAMWRVMSVKLQELIENMKNEGNKIACVVAEGAAGWAF